MIKELNESKNIAQTKIKAKNKKDRLSRWYDHFKGLLGGRGNTEHRHIKDFVCVSCDPLTIQKGTLSDQIEVNHGTNMDLSSYRNIQDGPFEPCEYKK